MRIFNKGDQFLRYIVIKTAAQVLIMIESQYGIQSCIDRFRPVFRLQIQRDDLFIARKSARSSIVTACHSSPLLSRYVK